MDSDLRTTEIEQIAELTARRVVEPVLAQMQELTASVNKATQSLYGVNGQDGVLRDMALLKATCAARHQGVDVELDTLRTLIARPEAAISRWTWMLAGAGATIGAVAIVLAIIREWVKLP